MNSGKSYKSPELIIALSALLISVVTACTSLYSAYIDRAYSRASVWPRLELFRSYSSNSFNYGVSNSGTGPALIKYAKVKYGSEYMSTWNEIGIFSNITQSHIHNRTLSAQQDIVPLMYKGDNISELLEADKLISIELCYCSIYEECWVVDRNSFPSPVDICEVNEEQSFNQ